VCVCVDAPKATTGCSKPVCAFPAHRLYVCMAVGMSSEPFNIHANQHPPSPEPNLLSIAKHNTHANTHTHTHTHTHDTHTFRLEEEERYLKMTAREIRRLCMLALAFIRQASRPLLLGHFWWLGMDGWTDKWKGPSPMIRTQS
jgi:hypothetical protein